MERSRSGKTLDETTTEGGEMVGESVAQGKVTTLSLVTDGVFFGKVFDLDDFHRDIPVEVGNCGTVEVERYLSLKL